MQRQTRTEPHYVLGHDRAELQRLDRQAGAIDRPTRLLLQAAGLEPGLRVLDLGTGLGHVARIVADFVGPTGSVVGIDQSAPTIAVARAQTMADGGEVSVTFIEGDVTTWLAPDPFDAIVTRCLLFHMPDPVAVVRHHLANLRAGGLFVALDFDVGSARAEPPVAVVDTAIAWVERGFRAAGAWPRIGARLASVLDDAGLTRVNTLGLQAYLQPHDPYGPSMLTGIVRSLAPSLIAHGIATAEELDLDTLERRIAGATRDADAVVLPPGVVGAWGYSPAASQAQP